jgi:hypothetical protein
MQYSTPFQRPMNERIIQQIRRIFVVVSDSRGVPRSRDADGVVRELTRSDWLIRPVFPGPQ